MNLSAPISLYAPYLHLVKNSSDDHYTLYIIVPIYQGQQIIHPGAHPESGRGIFNFQIQGAPLEPLTIIYHPMKIDVLLDEPSADSSSVNGVDVMNSGTGNGLMNDSGATPDVIVIPEVVTKVMVNIHLPVELLEANEATKRSFSIDLAESAKKEALTAEDTIYNTPYIYLYNRANDTDKINLQTLIPLRGYKYKPSLDETLIDLDEKKSTKAITLIKKSSSTGMAIPPVLSGINRNNAEEDKYGIIIFKTNKAISVSNTDSRLMERPTLEIETQSVSKTKNADTF